MPSWKDEPEPQTAAKGGLKRTPAVAVPTPSARVSTDGEGGAHLAQAGCSMGGRDAGRPPTAKSVAICEKQEDDEFREVLSRPAEVGRE